MTGKKKSSNFKKSTKKFLGSAFGSKAGYIPKLHKKLLGK